MSDIKRIDPKEFQELGFLQEVNRQFFHPLGLALEVVIEDDGSVKLGGIWDYRDDPEGMIFGAWNEEDFVKAQNVHEEWERHRKTRLKMFGSDRDDFDGSVIQEVGYVPEGHPTNED